QVAEAFVAKGRREMTKAQIQKVSLDDLFNQIQDGKMKELNIVVKADVQGSVEAVRQSLEKLSDEEVRVRIIHGGVGAINESDVMLASASGAIIIGFNIRPEAAAKSVADEQGVDIRLYRVIYSAIEDVQAAMKGMLDPIFEEKIIGHAEIRQTFKASSVGTIAGSYILDGKFQRNAKTRIYRDDKLIFEGNIDALKRFKDDVKEVNAGYECGITFEKFNDIREGDTIEAYVIEEVKR
ncbi:MAG: translation initiation factor IF-2, partial [Clostridiales bacterium]|nr:translation initiation factor IF-2 [Clostridiales bacterium]